MSTVWHPYTEPPKSGVYVTLRFGDDGERDAIGFFSRGPRVLLQVFDGHVATRISSPHTLGRDRGDAAVSDTHKPPKMHISGFGMVGEICIPAFFEAAPAVRHPLKPGRWRTRDGRNAVVLYRGGTPSYPWVGRINGSDVQEGWSGFGDADLQRSSGKDLIEYLGPLEKDT